VWAYNGPQQCNWLQAKTWIFDDTMAVIGSANFNRRGLSHDGELGVGVVDLNEPRDGWVHELRTRLWLKHLSTPKRPVTKDQVVDFEPGRSLWVDTPDTYLSRMDIIAGDSAHPDTLIFCDQPESSSTSRMQRFIRSCACDVPRIADQVYATKKINRILSSIRTAPEQHLVRPSTQMKS